MTVAQSSSLYGGWKTSMHLEANINHSQPKQRSAACAASSGHPRRAAHCRHSQGWNMCWGLTLLRGFCTAPFTLTQLPGGSAVPLCEGAEPWFGPSSMILPSLGICSVKWESESSWDSTGNLSHPQSHKEAACDPNMLEFAILRRRSADIKGCGTDTSWEFTPAFP